MQLANLTGAQTPREGEIYRPYFSGKQVLRALGTNHRFSKFGGGGEMCVEQSQNSTRSEPMFLH